MKEWSVRNAAMWGVALGAAYMAASTLYTGEPRPSGEWIGLIVGGALGGAILFAGIAGVRNYFGRA